MKRTLEELQSRYNSSTKATTRHGRPGPGMGRNMGPKGKPKNTKAIIKRMFSYLRPSRFKLVLVMFLMLITTITSLIASYLLAPVINRLTIEVLPDYELKPSKTELLADSIISSLQEKIGNWFPIDSDVLRYVLTAICLFVVIYSVSIVCTYFQQRIMARIATNTSEKIRNELFEKMQKLPLRYFDSNPTGELMSRYTNDVDNIDRMLGDSLVTVISGVITIIGTLVIMFLTNVWLSLITIVFVPIYLKGGTIIGKLSSKYYSSQQAALGALNGYIEESVNGVKVVKVFNHEEIENEEFQLLNDDMRNKQFYAQFWGGVMGPIMGNASQVAYAVTIGVGGVLMCTSGFAPGALTIFSQYSKQFSRPINTLSQQMATVFGALAGAERVFALMDEKPEVDDVPNAKEIKTLKGEVVLDHVSFGYIPEKIVLKDLSLYAHAGQKVAFVGSTGAGKTTITNLLNRFYDIEQGTITIDGVNIKEYKRDDLRENITMVLQDTHLFTGSVMENIRYGRLDATDEEVIEAAKVASAHSMIMRLSEGYDTILTGDGANLSQGQRQLLNIARAALSKAPILVLDEATSSVDTRTERHIEHGMDRLMKTRTTFVIAHRLSTVRNSNVIMVLEKGEIIERGTHEQLLDLKGRYYELYTGQKELD